MFFTKDILQYYTIPGWLNPWMQNRRYREPPVKLYAAFRLLGGSAPLTPELLKSQLYHNHSPNHGNKRANEWLYLLSIAV